MRRPLLAAVLGMLILAACGGESDATAAKNLRLVKLGDFTAPVYATSPDDKHVYIVEQAGRILVRHRGRTRTFLDIRGKVTSGGEQGLLSVAFRPDFFKKSRNGFFYVYYTDRAGDQRVAEFRSRSAVEARRGSERLVLRMADSESNHNGGLLQFYDAGPLYVGTGDGGGGGDQHGRIGNAQNKNSLLGKILRIDPRTGKGWPGNPFVGRAGRDEIWAYGLRNPWRYDFDDRGNLAIADVGQNAFEEVNYVSFEDAFGANFGWRPFEGNSRYVDGEKAPGHVPPVLTFSHDDGNCSITGGVFARDRSLPDATRGRYLFGDLCKGEILAADLPSADVEDTGLRVQTLASFGESARGRVYVVSLRGPVYRLARR